VFVVKRVKVVISCFLAAAAVKHNTNIALAHSISLPLAEKEKTATLQKVPLAQQQPINMENVVVLLFAGVTNSAVHAQGWRTSDRGCDGGGKTEEATAQHNSKSEQIGVDYTTK